MLVIYHFTFFKDPLKIVYTVMDYIRKQVYGDIKLNPQMHFVSMFT